MSRTRTFLSLFVLAGLLAGLMPGFLGAREIAPQESLPTGDVVARIYYGIQENLNAIAARYDVWQVDKDQGYAMVLLSPEEYRFLLDQGYRIEIDAKRTYQVQHPETIPGYPCYRTVEETYTSLDDLNTAYPDLVALYDIGDSWEKVTSGGQPGYDIRMIRITNENISGTKPRFFLMAEIHAREYATAELAMRVVEYILENYGTNPEVTYFVDYHEIFVVPMVNPDGRKLAEAGDYWRKNTDSDDGCSDPNSWGTDLNRNYAFKWGCCGGSSGYPCDETYRGPGRNSAAEPETQAIQNIVVALFPDQNGPNGDDEIPSAAPSDAPGILITLHSAAALLLWPWGFQSSAAPNGPALATIGNKLATYNDYDPGQSYTLYPTDGTTDDWSYGKLGIPSFTYELAGEFFQPCSAFENTDVPDNRASLLYAWKIAETPYLSAYGPDALSAAVTPGAVPPGTPVQLTATVNDSQNGNQTVNAAEYYVLPLHNPTPPGDPGSGTAMSPADGSWNSSVEGVTAAVDTSALAPGSYIIALRGRDSSSNWGPLTAAFLYVVEPGVSPTIAGYVRDASNNMPVGATVTAGTFQTTSDPATGYYSMTVVSGTYDMSAFAAGYAISNVAGIAAQNYQTVQQDFYLAPVCEVFADDVEGGNVGWTPAGSWAITTESSHSPTHSWTDSPGGNYGNNWNYAVTSPIMDLGDYSGTSLGFWHIYDLEDGYDYGYLEVSTNGGSSWTEVASYNGEDQNTWMHEEVAVPALDNQANARIRFRIDTDYYYSANGWHIDDVVVTGGGPGCISPLAPTAGFISNSPVDLGQPVVFTNMTTGTLPMDYLWSFGDGDTSTEVNPEHLYAQAGTYTVTLDAANAYGTDSVSHAVVVQPVTCVDLTSIAIAGPTTGEPGLYTFTTSYTPPAATPPIAYLWDDGGTGELSVRDLDVGTHTLIVTATNCTDTVVVDSHIIVITPTPVCTEVTGVDLTVVTTGTIYPGDEVAFSADVAPDDAAKPYSYTVDYGDGTAPVSGAASADPLAWSYSYTATGAYTVEIAVWNCAMAAPVVDTVQVIVHEPGTCVGLTSITIAGPTAGEPGLYTFTTSYTPPAATPPIAYLWDDGGTGELSVRDLDVGTHTLIVTATNCTDTVAVDSHTIVITSTPVCTEVTGVDLTVVTTGTIYPGDEVAFSADLAPDDAAPPYSYRVSVDGTAGPTQTGSLDPIAFTHTFGLTGTHAVEIAVWNCTMAAPVVDTVEVVVYEPGTCVGLTSITIAGPTAGAPGLYTFTTSYAPAGASLPIAYLWDDGGTAGLSVRDLGVGTYDLVITATNCTSTVVVDTHTIVISAPAAYYLYLPLIVK